MNDQMRIPDSIDSVPLTRETIVDLAARTGIDPLLLFYQLDQDEARGFTSVYVFQIYNSKQKPVISVEKRPKKAKRGKHMFDNIAKSKAYQELRERPVEVAGVVIGAIIAVAKVADTVAGIRSKNAYAKQVRNQQRAKKQH